MSEDQLKRGESNRYCSSCDVMRTFVYDRLQLHSVCSMCGWWVGAQFP
jgi:hypothetical protein